MLLAMIFHVTARALGRLAPFTSFEAAAFAWERLRAAFSEALAVVLMLNHLHMIIDFTSALALAHRLGAVLSGLTRNGLCGSEHRIWQPVPEPKPVEDLQKLRRQVRYVALNPCRAHLCADPLEWVWSTHRDVLGAVTKPWVTAERLAASLQFRSRGFAPKQHAYVSGDPDVRVDGTPPPLPAPGRESALVPLEAVAAATAAAFRLPVSAVASHPEARRTFVQLAHHQGWRDPRLLGSRCGVGERHLRNLAHPPAAGFEAARLCLGDARLTYGGMPVQIAESRHS
jgi:hypothetical protein